MSAATNRPVRGTVTAMSRRLADRYLLGDEVGVGGTSRVHVALDERLGRQVAVKLHDASAVATADPAGRERFLREGRTTAGFSHRHAVTVYDAGEDAGDLYIVMEFVDGPSLAEHLARNGPLPVDEMVRISRQVLSALAAAHAAGIVHRDVKPANILIGADGDTKLADFGIAKRFDDLGASVTTIGMVIGTPRYLAPEQALGHAATPATDVYSMGVVMFEMLTGRRPFDTDPPVAAQQSPALRLRSAGVPAALAAVVAWALETQPDERPSTAAALLVALDAASSQQAASTGVAEPTLLMPAATRSVLDGPAATEVLPTAAANASTTERSSGRTAILLFAGLLVVLGGAVAAATLGSDDVVDRAVVATALTSPQSVPADTAPLVTAPAVIETTVPAATVITARVVEVVVPEPTVVTLVPGFPATDDLEVFLFQVESDPDLLGQSGAELADELRKVIELRGVEQRKAAEKLQEVLAKWVADGEIPSAVGVALDELLAQLAKKD
jgi:serine/threonine-protein kinase